MFRCMFFISFLGTYIYIWKNQNGILMDVLFGSLLFFTKQCIRNIFTYYEIFCHFFWLQNFTCLIAHSGNSMKDKFKGRQDWTPAGIQGMKLLQSIRLVMIRPEAQHCKQVASATDVGTLQINKTRWLMIRGRCTFLGGILRFWISNWKEWRMVNHVWEMVSFRDLWDIQMEVFSKQTHESDVQIGGQGLRSTDTYLGVKWQLKP